MPACLSAKSCLLSSTSVWVHVPSPMSLGVSGQPRLAPPSRHSLHLCPQIPLAPEALRTRGFWAHPAALRPTERWSQKVPDGSHWATSGPLTRQVGRLSYHPCLGHSAHHSGLEEGKVVCAMGQAPAAGRHTSPLVPRAWALSHLSCDKHICRKDRQNQIPGSLETTPPAMPFWSELSLILSLGIRLTPHFMRTAVP